MRDLSAFADESFGLIFHPCSNGFIPDILPVWSEAFRVLRPGGVLLAGFVNPVLYHLRRCGRDRSRRARGPARNPVLGRDEPDG